MHPLLMPSYGTVLIFHYNSYLAYSFTPGMVRAISGIVFVTTFLLPTVISYLLLKKGLVKSFEMDDREERTLPFVSTCFCYCICYYLLNRLYLPPVFNLLIMGATTAVVLATLINLKWKISIHMIGIGGIVGALISLSQKILQDMQPAILLFILLSGLLGTSRLLLRSHNDKQVYAGFLVGMCTGFIMLLL